MGKETPKPYLVASVFVLMIVNLVSDVGGDDSILHAVYYGRLLSGLLTISRTRNHLSQSYPEYTYVFPQNIALPKCHSYAQ